jgi:hypothetical protein
MRRTFSAGYATTAPRAATRMSATAMRVRTFARIVVGILARGASHRRLRATIA